jgi:metal-sulfur cluster biosynthetic enzyme
MSLMRLKVCLEKIFTELSVFELVRNITDPEHPLTLEELHIIALENISVQDKKNMIIIQFTPTIPHCNVANIIGLMIRVKLLRSLPMRFKVNI